MEDEDQGEVCVVSPAFISSLPLPLLSLLCKSPVKIQIVTHQILPCFHENYLTDYFVKKMWQKKNFQETNAPYVRNSEEISKSEGVGSLVVFRAKLTGGKRHALPQAVGGDIQSGYEI